MKKFDLNNSSVELREIFLNAPLEFIVLIPKNIIKNLIELSTKTDYMWKYNTNKKFEEQNFSETTRNILFYLYLNYVCDYNKKIEIKKLIKEKDYSLNLEKQVKYSYEKLFKRNRKD